MNLNNISLNYEFVYHGKPDISFLESRSIIGAVPGDSDNLSIGADLAVDDALHQVELVDWLRTGQHAKPGPDEIQLLLRHL